MQLTYKIDNMIAVHQDEFLYFYSETSSMNPLLKIEELEWVKSLDSYSVAGKVAQRVQTLQDTGGLDFKMRPTTSS